MPDGGRKIMSYDVSLDSDGTERTVLLSTRLHPNGTVEILDIQHFAVRPVPVPGKKIDPKGSLEV